MTDDIIYAMSCFKLSTTIWLSLLKTLPEATAHLLCSAVLYHFEASVQVNMSYVRL